MTEHLIELVNTWLKKPSTILEIEDSEKQRLLWIGVVISLIELKTIEALDELVKVARSAPREDIRSLAISALFYLASREDLPAKYALFSLAIDFNHTTTMQSLAEKGFTPDDDNRKALFFLLSDQETNYRIIDPHQYRITQIFKNSPPELQERILAAAFKFSMNEWALIANAIRSPIDEMDQLGDYWPHFTRQELKNLAFAELSLLAKSDSEQAQQTICNLYLRYEDQTALELALAMNYLPKETSDRALFYYLTGQLKQYQDVDFDHRLLSTIYENASRWMRSRILSKARQSGKSEWLITFGHNRHIKMLGDLTDNDWQLTLKQLTDQKRFEELWHLAQASPPIWGAQILKILDRATWHPDEDGECQGFFSLLQQVNQCYLEKINIPQKRIQLPFRDLTAIAASINTNHIAVGSSDSTIWLGSSTDAHPFPAITTPSSPVTCLTFGRDGKTIASAHGDQKIRVWEVTSGKLLKALDGHQALVKTIAISQDNLILASAGFDRTLRLWRYPYGPALKTIPQTAEIFSLVISPDSRRGITAGADALISIWSLVDGTLIDQFNGHTDTITSLALSHDGIRLASSSRDHTIRSWSLMSGSQINVLEEPDMIVNCLAFHPEHPFLAGGTVDGTVLLWDTINGQKLYQNKPSQTSITSLTFTQDGKQLICTNKIGELILWDIRGQVISRLPIDSILPGELFDFQNSTNFKRLGHAEQAWMSFIHDIVQWRRRYDIEISEFQQIELGEFDIEI